MGAYLTVFRQNWTTVRTPALLYRRSTYSALVQSLTMLSNVWHMFDIPAFSAEPEMSVL